MAVGDRVRQVAEHVSPPSIVRGSVDTPLLEVTIDAHLRSIALRQPDAVAIASHWQRRRLTYGELVAQSDSLARALVDRRVRAGDRVAICAGNCVEYVLLFYAVIKLGAIAVVVNPSYTEGELLRAMRAAEPKLLIMSLTLGERSFAAHVEVLCAELASLPLVFIRKDAEQLSAGAESFADLLRQGTQSTTEIPFCTDQNQVVNMQFTSGTTGAPKAAMLTHRNVLNNGHNIGLGMRLTPEDRLCIPVPLFHCFGLVLGNMAAFSHGASVVYPSEVFKPQAVLEAVEAHRCTALHSVPTMFIAMLELLERGDRHYDLGSLRTGIAAGTIVNAGLMQRIQSRMSLPKLVIVYGQTETSPGSTMTTVDDDFAHRTTTVGRAMPHTTLKLCDPAGQTVPRGAPGEVWVAGYLLQRGYWRDAAASEATLTRERCTNRSTGTEEETVWLRSGDVGVLDHDGYLRIAGRIKDLIVRGGENISPAEVEDTVAAHAAVLDVAVVGVEDEKYGEVVGCFIRLKPGSKPDAVQPQKLREFVKGKLAHYKAPQHAWALGEIGGLGLPDDFPKTASGKIQKFVLRDWTKQLLRQS